MTFKMSKRRFLIGSISALAAPAVVRAAGSQDTLHVCDMPPFQLERLVEASGALKDAPYKVEWSLFTSGAPAYEAVAAGAIDVMEASDVHFFTVTRSGIIARAVSAVQYGPYIALVVKRDSGIASLRDLKGKRIATTRGGGAHALALALIEAGGLTLEDVDLSFMPPSDGQAAFSAGHIDAWVTWPPLLTTALASGEAVRLGDVTDTQLRWRVNNYNIVSTAATAKAEIARDFLLRLEKARSWGAEHHEEFANIHAEANGFEIETARQLIEQMDPRPAPITEEMITGLSDALTLMEKYGLVENTNLDGLFDLDFLKG